MPSLRITCIRGSIGFRQDQKDTVRALGLHRLHESVEHEDSPQLRGMLRKVRHLVKVEAQA